MSADDFNAMSELEVSAFEAAVFNKSTQGIPLSEYEISFVEWVNTQRQVDVFDFDFATELNLQSHEAQA